MVNPLDRFTDLAPTYDTYRPGYPADTIDWILALAPKGRIADIGCGTGISTRLLAARGRDVVGIEPNDDMLGVARAGGGRYLKGESVATGLPDRTIALITAAQAFHWFEIPSTLKEWSRIAEPGGWACAFWNSRADTPFLAAYDAILKRFSPDYTDQLQAKDTLAAIRAAVPTVREARFAHRQVLDRDGFFGRVNSLSYVKHGVTKREEFDAALEDLFGKWERGGEVVFDYHVDVIAWQP